jgi:diguanylate cyclase (GGDEF)-like protein
VGLFIALGFAAAIVAIAAAWVHVLRMRVRALEAQVVTDPLTGAFNRRQFDRSLAQAIERRARSGEPASLLVFDVDRFKELNDTRGHAAGDAVLKAIVQLFARHTRKLDALFRIGGEEFALVLAGAGYDDAMRVAEEFRIRIASAAFADACTVSISAGVSELEPGQSAADWIADADAALYAAKRDGRNRVAGNGRWTAPMEATTVRVAVPTR